MTQLTAHSLLPNQFQRAMWRSAIVQIEIDEALIRTSHAFRNGLEIRFCRWRR